MSLVARVDAESGEVISEWPIVAEIKVGKGYGKVVVDDDVWVLNSTDQSVSRIDSGRNLVTATISFGGGADPGDLAVAAHEPWVTDPVRDRVHRLEPLDEQITTIRSDTMPSGLVVADGDVWVANHHGRPSPSVWRIDPESEQVVARIPIGESVSEGPQWMAASAGSVWVGVPSIPAVVRIDPRTNQVEATIRVEDGGVCGQLIADDTAVWVAAGLCGDGLLTRIDPRTNEVVARIESPHWNTVFGGALGHGSLWLSTDQGPVAIDPTTNKVTSYLTRNGDRAFGGDIAFGGGSFWLHEGLLNTMLRIEPT